MKTITKDNFTAHIVLDEYGFDPREGDFNLSKLCLSCKKFNLSNELELDFNKYYSWEEVESELKKTYRSDILLLKQVFMYEHSAISLSYNVTCSFDSGRIGYQLVFKSDVRKIFNVKRISRKLFEQVEKEAKQELIDYSNYLNGNVYRIVFEEDDEILEDLDISGIYDFNNAVKIAKEELSNLTQDY